MNKKLLLIGASGHGKVVADIAIRNGYEILGFLDDNSEIKDVMGFPVLGKVADAVDYLKSAQMCVTIGDGTIRSHIMTDLMKKGAIFPVMIHPNAVVGMDVTINPGTVVMAGAVINPGVTIGEGCIINTCASVDHDCLLEEYVHVSVGAHVAGTVCVGRNTWIGAGATIKNNVSISCDCIIGAGAVVVKNIKEAGKYVGVPAKVRV